MVKSYFLHAFLGVKTTDIVNVSGASPADLECQMEAALSQFTDTISKFENEVFNRCREEAANYAVKTMAKGTGLSTARRVQTLGEVELT
jgi:hypothetical protein